MRNNRCSVVAVILVGVLAVGLTVRAAGWKDTIEADWQRQAAGGSIKPTARDRSGRGRISAREDAWGAVDGIKNGGTGFHTNQDNNPWWQVDLGKAVALDHMLVTNREDCADRANRLMVLLSTNGRKWQRVYQHDGTSFHGGPDKKPLKVALNDAKARYVRIALPGRNFLHLDEVEVFAAAGHVLSGHKDKDGKPRVKLDAESFRRLVAWLDLNAQYYGDYSHNRPERRRPTAEGEKAIRAEIARLFGDKLAAQPIDALINIAGPGRPGPTT